MTPSLCAVLPGSPCSASSAPCANNAQCLNERCVCSLPGTVSRQGSCITDDSTPTTVGMGNGAAPSCTEAFVATPLVTAVPLGGACTRDEQCMVSTTAQCRNGVCFCRNGYIPDQGRCVPLGTGGGSGTSASAVCAELPRTRRCICSTDRIGVHSVGAVRQRRHMHQWHLRVPARQLHNGRAAVPVPPLVRYLTSRPRRSTCTQHHNAVPPGSWCSGTAGIDCYGGAYCHGNVCLCPFGQVILGLQCQEAPIGTNPDLP